MVERDGIGTSVLPVAIIGTIDRIRTEPSGGEAVRVGRPLGINFDDVQPLGRRHG
jgi:hypothetical protein